MKFTDRDGDMIRWINGHGFVTIRQIARWMGSSYQVAQRRAQRLANANFLTHCWPIRGERVHGPKYYLSVSRSGAHPEMAYVPKARQAEVAQALACYRRIREILDELCAINRELLRRREGF